MHFIVNYSSLIIFALDQSDASVFDVYSYRLGNFCFVQSHSINSLESTMSPKEGEREIVIVGSAFGLHTFSALLDVLALRKEIPGNQLRPQQTNRLGTG